MNDETFEKWSYLIKGRVSKILLKDWVSDVKEGGEWENLT